MYVEVRGVCFKGFRSTSTVNETKRNENLDKLAGDEQWKCVMFTISNALLLGGRTLTYGTETTLSDIDIWKLNYVTQLYLDTETAKPFSNFSGEN